MATYGYIRTSRDQEPGHPGSDPEVQGRQFADAGVKPARIYADVAVSGDTPGNSAAADGLLAIRPEEAVIDSQRLQSVSQPDLQKG